ncbi:MAG: SxtJ family membrane protein [Candidatus Omnitrophica bacterium]|nr:SxtJ family membrane protein [Candidatus Omnitrophota bacterium]
MLDDIKNIKSGPKQLKECGLTVGIFLVIIGFILFLRHRPHSMLFIVTGGSFCFIGAFFCKILLPFQKTWMTIAIVLGFFVNRLILMILFFLILTPIGFVTKIMKKDLLDEKIEKKKPSYWKELNETKKEKESYEKQY